MNDKEERILILSVKPFYEDEIAYEDIDVHMEDLPTRTEAIERMAEAMSAPYFNDVHASEVDMLQALAEAALDALLQK